MPDGQMQRWEPRVDPESPGTFVYGLLFVAAVVVVAFFALRNAAVVFGVLGGAGVGAVAGYAVARVVSRRVRADLRAGEEPEA